MIARPRSVLPALLLAFIYQDRPPKNSLAVPRRAD
jgi:hypothetical protein